MRSIAGPTRAAISAFDSAPGMTSQRSCSNIWSNQGVTLSHSLTVDASFPFAQVHLGQRWFDRGREPEASGERCRRLLGPTETCDINGVNSRRRQAGGDPERLFPPERGQSRVTPSAHEGERVGRIGGFGLAVPYEQHFCRPDRRFKTDLAVLFLLRANILLTGH